MTTAQIAQRATLNPRTGHFEIDGTPFPWWVRTDVTVEAGPNDITAIIVRIPLEHGVLIDDEYEPELREEAHE